MAGKDAAGPVTPDEADRLFRPLADMDLIAAAVSGGGDSVALMRLLAGWAAAVPGRPKVHVLTVNHGIRPEAAFEADQVSGWAAAAGLAHETLKGRATPPAAGLQAFARGLRYRMLTDWVRRRGADAIVLAHNQEDQAETLAMRLARGSGVGGLSAMAADTSMHGVRILRPLLEIGRDRLRATLTAAGQAWLEDPSNRDERFERVRVRRALAPGGAAARLGLTAAALGRSATRLARADAALDHYAREFLLAGVTYDEAGYAIVDAATLAWEPDEIRLRALGEILARIGGRDVRHGARLEAVLARLDAGATAATLAGCRIAARSGRWMVTREVRGLRPLRLAPGETVLWDARFSVDLVGCGEPVEVRSLGTAGFARARVEVPSLFDIPPVAGKALPGGFLGPDLVAPPVGGRWLRLRFRHDETDGGAGP